MLRVVSVETGLDDIKAHLNNCGYQVIDMVDCIYPVEAVIYTGQPVIQTVQGRKAKNTVMINAAGLTGEQVAASLEEKLG